MHAIDIQTALLSLFVCTSSALHAILSLEVERCIYIWQRETEREKNKQLKRNRIKSMGVAVVVMSYIFVRASVKQVL